MILQLIIVLSSCGAIALLAQRDPALRWWGCIAGLCGQPAWLYEAARHQQWGVLLVALWWSGWYAWGIWQLRDA